MPAILDHGDVDIDDVAVLQDLGIAGNAMADHVVDRRADRLREAVVADVGRDRLLHVDNVLVADPVQLFGGHARLHERGDHVQHLGRQAAGDAHHLDFFWGFKVHAHRAIITHPAHAGAIAAATAPPAGRRARPGRPLARAGIACHNRRVFTALAKGNRQHRA